MLMLNYNLVSGKYLEEALRQACELLLLDKRKGQKAFGAVGGRIHSSKILDVLRVAQRKGGGASQTFPKIERGEEGGKIKPPPGDRSTK